ncbi:MgtC SapB transporter [Ferriphaselus amnicola]|uniref:Protein MgtC n=1 Tax=Ferriphaselus amnicola TaxID=1188319 RepID=A0A2Z6G9L8_9PROT|nr:MgtC/SapB family protein [Ferriphaselus amnicola]BBE50231.1 MgtC SapB transporter [Ferriphaselus amnicola]
MSESLQGFWTLSALHANLLIILNLIGALALGLLVGYERSYHGRAAGMRTYGLVCMASAALTVAVGHPHFWYGGGNTLALGADPTRTIQGIVTGIGFLGAGVIMREGLNISGLTTAASIWAASAIGIMVGLGFYLAAISFALLSTFSMMWGSRLEEWLPSRKAIAIVLHFKAEHKPHRDNLHQLLFDYGYQIAEGSLSVAHQDGKIEWRFVAIATSHSKMADLNLLAQRLTQKEGIEEFQLSHARN